MEQKVMTDSEWCEKCFLKVITEAESLEIGWQFDQLVKRICRLNRWRSDYHQRMLRLDRVTETEQETILPKPLAVVESWSSVYQKLFFDDYRPTGTDYWLTGYRRV